MHNSALNDWKELVLIFDEVYHKTPKHSLKTRVAASIPTSYLFLCPIYKNTCTHIIAHLFKHMLKLFLIGAIKESA
jgi:hypothetical protein